MRRFIFVLTAVLPVWAFAADLTETLRQLDATEAYRDDSARVPEIDKALDEALKAFPNEYEVLWRAARHKYWLADTKATGQRKSELGKQAWELGDRAIKAKPNGV